MIKFVFPFQRPSFPYQGLSFQIKGLEIGKFKDKYLLCVFSTFVYLPVTNLSYVIGWPAMGLGTLDEM